MKRSKHLDVALQALHVMAKSLRLMSSVSYSEADNDNDSGEIIFTVRQGETEQSYVLRLQEFRED